MPRYMLDTDTWVRQPRESRGVYLTNSRVIITNLSALAVLMTRVWRLARFIR